MRICYKVIVRSAIAFVFLSAISTVAAAQSACRPPVACAYLSAAGESPAQDKIARFLSDEKYASAIKAQARERVFAAGQKYVSTCSDASVAELPDGMTPFETALFADAFASGAQLRVEDFNPFSRCAALSADGLLAGNMDADLYGEAAQMCESAAFTAYHGCLKNSLEYRQLRECRENYRRFQRESSGQKKRIAGSAQQLKQNLHAACSMELRPPLEVFAERRAAAQSALLRAEALFDAAQSGAKTLSLSPAPGMDDMQKLAALYSSAASSFALPGEDYGAGAAELAGLAAQYRARLEAARAQCRAVYSSSAALAAYAGLAEYDFKTEADAAARAEAAVSSTAADAFPPGGYAAESAASARAAELWKNAAAANAAYVSSAEAALRGLDAQLHYGGGEISPQFIAGQNASFSALFAAAAQAREQLSGRAAPQKPLPLEQYRSVYAAAASALETLHAQDLAQRLRAAVAVCEDDNSGWAALSPRSAQAAAAHEKISAQCARVESVDAALALPSFSVYALWNEENVLRSLSGLLEKDFAAEDLLARTLEAFAESKPLSCKPGLTLALRDYAAAPWKHSPEAEAAFAKLSALSCP
jgi:hypothetical protein